MMNELIVYKLDDFEFKALLEDKFTRDDVDLIDAYAIHINDVKSIKSTTIKLSKYYPFDLRWQFIKRIKPADDVNKDKFKFLIGPVESIDKNELEINLKSSNLNTTIELVKIAKYKPLTRKQFEFCKFYWPCNFYEYKYVEKCLAGQNLFDNENFIASNLNRLIELTKERKLCTTIIANKQEVVTECSSGIDEHFLYHSAFKAVNKVAEDRLKFINENSKNNIVIKDSKPVILPYLCTSYDVYSTNEPCVVCAMALVHSRIKRLFFLDLEQFNLNINQIDCMDDCAISKLQIHLKKGLNHHFEVFKVGLKEINN